MPDRCTDGRTVMTLDEARQTFPVGASVRTRSGLVGVVEDHEVYLGVVLVHVEGWTPLAPGDLKLAHR